MTLPVEVEFPFQKFERLFLIAPDVMFWHLRDTMGAAFGSHRKNWLARTKAKVAIGGSKGLVAKKQDSKTGRPGGFAGQRSIFYRVQPKTKKRAVGQTLDAIEGETFTHSPVALGLEKGGTFRSKKSRFLAIPIGVTLNKHGKVIPRWSSPTKFRRGKKPKEVLALPSAAGMQGPGHRGLTLFWRKGKRNPTLLPAFKLVRKVTRQKRLKFMDTWDTLRGDRSRRFAAALSKAVRDIVRLRKPVA